MKRSALGIMLLVPAVLPAQQDARSLLWRITGNGLSSPGFVYGTVHSRAELAYSFVEAVEATMDSVFTVAGELDLEAGRKQAATLMSAMMLPEGKRLEDLYSRKDWRVVESGIREELGPMAPFVMAMKPTMVLATLTEAEMGQDRSLLLDDHLLREAKAREKRVIGLETLAEQVRALDVLSLKEQARMLLEHFTSGDRSDELERMMSAYAAQDLETLMDIVHASSTMPGQLERSLITDRNRVMALRMDSVLQADGSSLFLVGAAHLPGPEGILKLLVERGYTVLPLPLDAHDGDGAQQVPVDEAPMFLVNGVRFHNDTLGFSVDMPSPPMKLAQGDPASGVFLTNWMSDDHEGNSYMVFTCALGPSQTDLPSDQLLLAIAAGGEQQQGELIEISEASASGFPALRALVHLPLRGRYMRMLLVRPAADLAYVLVIVPRTGTDAPQGEAFFRSFILPGQ